MSEAKPVFLRIKPPPSPGTGAHPVQGTIVETLDGHRVGGVTGITLRAGINDVWRATIECHVQIDDALDVEVTDLAEVESRQYVAASLVVQQAPIRMLLRAVIRRLLGTRPKTGADHLPAPMPAAPPARADSDLVRAEILLLRRELEALRRDLSSNRRRG